MTYAEVEMLNINLSDEMFALFWGTANHHRKALGIK
jgi:hypothetical protein